MDEARPKIRYNLRSSLKKSFRNPLGSLDVSDEGEDITLPPQPRRVSFAASSTVKPFVNDPEKNTIWDNTYEEEINHTDSNNVLSLDSHSNIQEIQRVNVNFNQSLVNLEATLSNSGESSMELTNCAPSQTKSTAGESMELTCQWKNNIIDNNKVFVDKIAKNLLGMSANCTQIQEMDMSLTNCGFAIANKENIQLPIGYASHSDQVSHSKKKTLLRQKRIEPFADKSLLTKTIKDPVDMELTCKFSSEPVEPMEIDETLKTSKNCTIYQESDMSMTCKFSNIIINKENVFSSEKIDNDMPNVSDMEFTCTFPPKNVSGVKNQLTVNKDSTSTQSSSDQSITNMEFARRFGENNLELQKTSNFNPAGADMEFTCQFPDDKSINFQKIQRNANIKSSKINQTGANMEITCQFTEQEILEKTQKNAEFPPKVFNEKEISTLINQSSGDMEFTCKFSQNIVQQMNRNVIVPQNSAPGDHKTAKSESLKTYQPSTGMELTCTLPQIKSSHDNFQGLSSSANKSTVTVVSPKLVLSNISHSIGGNKLACQSSQGNADNTFRIQTRLNKASCSDAEIKLTTELPKTALKSIEIYSDDATYSGETFMRSLSDKRVEDNIANKENVAYLKQAISDVQGKVQQDSQSFNKENIYCIQELNKNHHDHSSFNMNFTCKTLLMENSSVEKYNEINSTAHISSVHKPKLQMEDTINVSLPELHLEPKDDTMFKAPKERELKEFGNSPVALDCPHLKIDHSNKDKHSNVIVQNESPILKANLNLAEQTIFVAKEDSVPITEITETKDISLSKDFKATITEFNKNETISAEECNLIDTLTSIVDEDLPSDNILSHGVNEHAIMRQEQCATPPKVIYSEPMKVVKPSTSMLDFSNGLSSGKKPFNFSSITSSIDGTQQLIEATFSKPTEKLDECVNNSMLKNESGLVLIDNTIDNEQRLVRNSSDRNSSFNSSSVRVQKLLDNIQHKIVKYEKPQFDIDDCHQLLQENQNLLDKVKYYLENCNSPEPQPSSLDEQVRRLSLANSSYNCSNMSDTISEDANDDTNNESVALSVPKTLHEKILEVVSNVEEHILKLQYNEENYYIFSAFSQGAWFAVDLHPEERRVTQIKTVVGLKKDSTSPYASVHEFIVDCICKKLEMCSLKSSLGTCFDVLSLLDHVIMITENCLEFCLEFIEANWKYKTLKMEPDGRVSFQILITVPPIWWAVQFKMASIGSIDQNSLKATSKWGTINEDHLKTILRNTEPGIDCIRRFVETVKDYFDRTQFMKLKPKDVNKAIEAV